MECGGMRSSTLAVRGLCINLSKPAGYLRTTRFNIKIFCLVITLHVCVLYGSQKKQ